MKTNAVKWIQPALLLTAAALVAVGIARGEVFEVFQKAVNICLACIGIG